jgi:hypothetical protein
MQDVCNWLEVLLNSLVQGKSDPNLHDALSEAPAACVAQRSLLSVLQLTSYCVTVSAVACST